jgi:ribonuclease Z
MAYNPKDISKISSPIFTTIISKDCPIFGMTPWFLLGRDHGFEMWGPEGTEQMVQGMRAMFGHDLQARVNQFNPIATLAIQKQVVSDDFMIRGGLFVVAKFGASSILLLTDKLSHIACWARLAV